MLDYSILNDQILMGEFPLEKDLLFLRNDHNVTAILNLTYRSGTDNDSLKTYGQRLGLVMTQLGLGGHDDVERLTAAVNLLKQLLEDGKKVYMHCVHGQIRTPLVALGYLTVYGGMDPVIALALIQKVRPSASPDLDTFNRYYRIHHQKIQ
jgi:hypothetical protein